MRFALRYQVFLPMAVLMVAALTGASVAIALLQSRQARLDLSRRLDRLTHTLRQSTYPMTAPVLEQLSGLSGAEFVLTDQQSVILFSTFRFDRGKFFELPSGIHGGPAERSPIEIAGERYFCRRVELNPLQSPASRQTLHVFFPEGKLAEARRSAIYPPLAVGALAIAVTGLISLVIARHVTRPIAAVRAQFDQLAAERYEPLPAPKRNDEIRDLMIAGNVLASRLQDLNLAVRRSERLSLLGRIGSGLAHQLRNSVTGARLAVQLHQRACASDGESLAVALRELEMAEEQVAAFLHLGEIRPSRHAPVDLASLAREVQRLMTPLCRHRGISLTTNLPDGQVLVPGNRGQLRQLLLNLLVNAVEASAGGAEVRLTLRADAASVRLCVEDEGPGVPPEVEHRIFDPFVTTKPEGVGLGLSVAQQIVQAHRGRLSYERIDRITVFSVTLSRIELAQEGHPESRCVEMMAHV